MIGTLLIGLFILFIVAIKRRWDESATAPIGIFFIIALVISMFLAGNIAEGRILDDKIVMYTEENQKIEEQIGMLVEEYMNYESNTYIETKGESAISLVALYPDLKADELVKKQINIHTSNNSTIKTLKEEKLNISTYKFWLYFGG